MQNETKLKDIINCARGSLIGLAVGDALGVPLEFKSHGTFEPVKDIIGGGSFNLKPGEWTDDTSMALCLAESLIEKQGFDPADQLERYDRWYCEGHLSDKAGVLILETPQEKLYLNGKTYEPYCGPTYERSAGNGSMRLAPVLISYFSSFKDAVSNAGKSSMTTHGHILTVDACRYMAGLIIGAMAGHSKENILSQKYCPINGQGAYI